ncbi:hypothetical protein GA0116948_11252 [Chitinophaga costaii]|uniref:CDP-Glycerol:Poly(Glycerophosphate) glycerophosphotransferase n=1 Tax=Chitinophaga costaii TaxID=1335309 RepID=A0A1C4F6E7_9BACT|nr:hypothetical protein [Chitinophaga costaii]PUZ21237.1 hypothetical protein DCM91_16990 [Chitinophaga costaii]SCC51599.1 hypothetical protein GA0116948_11252 [Chitinophaga costaii]
MINHIVFFTYLPLSEKIETDFYLQALLNNGYRVTYADISNISGKTIRHTIERPYILEVLTWDAFDNLLKDSEREDTIVLTNVTYNHESYALFRFISRYKVKLGFFARGMLPVPSLMENPLRRFLVNPMAYLSVYKAIRFLKNKMAVRAKMLGKIRPYDVLFVAGKNGVMTTGMGWQADLRHAKMVHINYFDFDQYHAMQNQDQQLISGKYAVFIDQYLPHHPDVKLFNLGEVPSERYFQKLNAFLDKVEATYGLKVVIAAHPKSDYASNPFNGRRLVKNETALLIRYAELVLTHVSSAISFCALYYKPVFMLYNETISTVFSQYQVRFMCDSIGGYFYDMDHETPLVPAGELVIDKKKYDRYKYDYLTSRESEQQQTVALFLNALKTL